MKQIEAVSNPELFAEVGYIGKIPVRNIWLLMLYASDLYRYLNYDTHSGVEENPDDIPNLVAEILTKHVEHRIMRNLTFSYQSRSAVLNRVRGRINVLDTTRYGLVKRGKVSCGYEELTVNTPRNRFVRFALDKLSRIVNRKELRSKCRKLSSTFLTMGVSGEKPSLKDISSEQYGRNDVQDRKMVSAARLVFELALLTEESGMYYSSMPARDEGWFRKLYEKAVAGFYDVVLPKPDWQVEAGRFLSWQIEAKTSGVNGILPSMCTDIILENRQKKRRIVIDTKFNSILTKGWYRDYSLRNSYLYQIYAYLRSQEGTENELNDKSAGLLLHPSVGEMIDEAVIIQGHEIRFATVDLAAEAKTIRKQLLKVVDIDLNNEEFDL